MNEPEKRKKKEVNKLEELYNKIYSSVKRYRRKHLTDEWQFIWKNIKNTLIVAGVAETPLGEWNPEIQSTGEIHKIFASRVLNLPEYQITGLRHQNMMEHNHFLIQLFRIPIEETLTVKSLCKIAFYAGMLSAQFGVRDFPEGLVKTLKDLQIWKLKHFIPSTEWSAHCDKIPSDLVGKINASINESIASDDE